MKYVTKHELTPAKRALGPLWSPDLEKSGYTPLHRAARDDASAEALELALSENSWDIDAKTTDAYGVTALHTACRHRNVNAVRELIAHGASLEIRDEEGHTPFLRAAHLSFHDGLDALVEARANVRETSHLGQTALHLALRADFDGSLLRHLLALGLGDVIDRQDGNGDTPLHCAVQQGDRRLVYLETLLEAHPHLEVRNRNGQTPLQIAARRINGPVQRLLRAGANPRVQDGEGRTLLDTCLEEHADVLRNAL